MESLLTDWATRGYLVVTATADTQLAGDAQLLQGRRPPVLLSPEVYFEQNFRLHRTLCARRLPHLRLSAGRSSDGPLVTAWLVPAPRTGKLTAIGFEQTRYELPPAVINAWLNDLARQLQDGSPELAFTVADRVFIQAPGGPEAPATGYHRTWRGDTPLPGDTPAQRLLGWLRTHPRYDLHPVGALGAAPAAAATEAAWQWLLPANPRSPVESMQRGTINYELRGGPANYPD